MILGRDLLIVIGALLYHYFVSHYEIKPSIWGKACTLLQIVYVLALMIDLAGWPMPGWSIQYGLYLVATITAISGMHYIAVWGRKAWRLKTSDQEERSGNE